MLTLKVILALIALTFVIGLAWLAAIIAIMDMSDYLKKQFASSSPSEDHE